MNELIKTDHHRGMWFHSGNRGPLADFPFINQMGFMRFSRVQLDETMLPHLNDGIEIHYVKSGMYNWVVEDESFCILPEQLSITKPWQLHGSPDGYMELGELFWIVITPEKFAPFGELRLGNWTRLPADFQRKLGNLLNSKTKLIIKNARKLGPYFEELIEEFSDVKTGEKIKVCNLIENILIEIYRSLQQPDDEEQMDKLFKHRLDKILIDNLSEKLVIEELAAHFHMGKTSFTEKVRTITGYPPHSYILKLRIDQAKDYLKQKDKTMTDIAYMCGFSSLQHFSLAFLQKTGVTPTGYMNSLE